MAKTKRPIPTQVDDESDNDSIQSNEPLASKRSKPISDCEDELPKKKRKREQTGLFRQPTAEEMQQLRETETLFHSNLFRLQIEEVLGEMRIKDKYRKLFEAWFLKFKKTVRSIPESAKEVSFASAESTIEAMGINVPRPTIPEDDKGVFKFIKPSDIRVIGSYSIGCNTGPDVTIDAMIEMPAKFFQKLDYRNYRYTIKRAIYLARIAASLGDELVESKKFTGSVQKPSLCLVPCGKLGKRVTLRVHLAAQEGSFKLGRFLPQKNSVRPEWYFEEEKHGNTSDCHAPTPHYNSLILHDLTISSVNSHNEKLIGEYPNMKDGIILLKIWLRQRQFNDSYDSFNGHIMTMYVIYLLLMKKLNTFMSSYQIVRNVWNNLALSDWTKNGPTMWLKSDSETRLLEYHKYYECVFLDSSGYHNLAAHLSAETYKWVRSEAERAIKCLDNPNLDSFQTLFMRPVPFYATFDNLICFSDGSVLEKIVDDKSSSADKLNYGPDKRAQAVKLLCNILREGLGQRVSNIIVQSERKPKEWQVKENAPSGIDKIIIGLSLDPHFCFNIIDKGPHANLKEAVEFRKFWGNKSELRRFQDGTICEALVWVKNRNTLAEKRIVCKKIVRYLLKEKFDLSKDQYEYVADQIDELLRLKKINGIKFAYGTGEEATLQVLRVFQSLEKELTSLTDLPLSISGVEGFSPVFRYTDVFPPLAMSCGPFENDTTKVSSDYTIFDEKSPKSMQPHVPQINVSLQLSLSGKWPDELEAVRKTKAAFHLQIADCLRKQHRLIAHGQCRWVDVFKDGFLFRLEVSHQREIALLKRQITEDRVEKYRDNEESIELEKRLFHLPKLTSALHGLHSHQPSFGATCCLAKRWLSAHLLDDSHIPDVVVELLVASMYLTPDPYKPAQNPQVAFLRFLELLARRHWNNEPIFVNFNNEMTREEIVAVENLYRSAIDSRPPVFISTPYDHNESIWTKRAPSRMILERIGSLAEETLKLFDEDFNAATNLSFRPFFVSPTSEYDCLIRLRSSLNPRRLQFHDLTESYPTLNWPSFDVKSNKKIPIIDFNPVDNYLRELRHAYDEIALFFHDTYGGSVIGVLIKPVALETKGFKISNMHCRKLNDEGKLVLNVSAMTDDFSIMGKGLVKSIDIQSKLFASN